jgi:hypothetical protein
MCWPVIEEETMWPLRIFMKTARIQFESPPAHQQQPTVSRVSIRYPEAFLVMLDLSVVI